MRDQRTGLGFDHGEEVDDELRFESVSWPHGYTAAKIEGQVVLFGPGGNEVAREGDRVQVTGAGGDPFFGCMNVELVERAPGDDD